MRVLAVLASALGWWLLYLAIGPWGCVALACVAVIGACQLFKFAFNHVDRT